MHTPRFEPWQLKPLVTLNPGKPKRWFQRLITAFGRDIVRGMMDVYRLDLEGEDVAVSQYRDARLGKSRFIVAFRHPGDNDPQLMYLTLNTRINPFLRKAGLPGHLGAIFLAGTEIPLWGGPVVTFALRNAGTIPVSHGALSKSTMDTIMSTLVDSPTPVAIAPEGQVTYYSHVLPDFDQGAAQIAIWAQGRLDDRSKKTGADPVSVNILPVGIVYRFPKETWLRLDRFTADCERMVGIDSALPAELLRAARKRGEGTEGTPEGKALVAHFRVRFAALWARLADEAVAFYENTYRYDEAAALARLAETAGTGAVDGAGGESLVGNPEAANAGEPPADPARTEARFRALSEFAMERAERYFGVEGKGTLRERVMFLRSHSMNLAFPEGPEGRERTWLEARLAERGCGDAYWLHRHQELVDLAWYLTARTVTENETFDRLVETAQNLMDLAQRLVGGSFGTRRRFFRKAVTVRFGEPIPVGESLAKGRREAMASISGRIREGFEDLLPR